jgi:cyclopropane fatty-acyl-phospholipid synthase-like methyltransferase
MSDNSFDPDAYDDDQSFVYEYGADLLDLLDPTPGTRILDLGCGNGHLTAEMATAADVVGVDADEDAWAADYRRLRFVAVREG